MKRFAYPLGTTFIALAALIGAGWLLAFNAIAADPAKLVPTIYKPRAMPDLETIPRSGISRNFYLVAHTDLGRAGADNNGNSLAFKDDCIYVGHRGDEAGLVVLDAYTLDIINELPRVVGSNTQEHRAIADLNLLVVMGFGSSAAGTTGVNMFQVWD